MCGFFFEKLKKKKKKNLSAYGQGEQQPKFERNVLVGSLFTSISLIKSHCSYLKVSVSSSARFFNNADVTVDLTEEYHRKGKKVLGIKCINLTAEIHITGVHFMTG